MKNKLDFTLSKATLIENVRLHWYIPFLMYLGYFLTKILPLCMSKSPSTSVFNNCSILDTFIILLFTFLTSISMTNYLHNDKKALMFSGIPVTKKGLHNTHFLTGLILLFIPIILVTLSYVIVLSCSNIPFELLSVLKYLYSSLIYITYYYSIMTLCGVLTGNPIIHILLTMYTFIVVPATTFLIKIFRMLFMIGSSEAIDTSIFSNSFLVVTFPQLFMHRYRGSLPFEKNLVYLGIALLIIILTNYLIGLFKYERIGKGIAFKTVDYIVTAFLSFNGMCIFSLIVCFINPEKSSILSILLLGVLFGLVFSFIIVRLILEKTVKIFNKKNFILFIVIFLIVIVFILTSFGQVIGYSNIVPDREDIVSANFIIAEEFLPIYHDYINDGTWVSSKESIDKLYDLNEYIVNNKLYVIPYKDVNLSDFKYITFEYKLANDKTFKRTYLIDKEQTEIKKRLNTVLTDADVINKRMIKDYKDSIYLINISSNNYMYDSTKDSYINEECNLDVSVFDKETISEIYDAFLLDLYNCKSPIMLDRSYYITMRIEFDKYTMFCYVTKDFTNTLNELKKTLR